VLQRCESLAPDAPQDAQVWCTALVPASLYALARDEDALTALAHTCSRVRPASAENEGRASILALTLVALDTAVKEGKLELDDQKRRQTIETWLDRCEVPPAQLEKVLNEME
jgi:hypothetical protein